MTDVDGSRDQERMNSSNKKVTSDILLEFFKICMPGLYSEMMVSS